MGHKAESMTRFSIIIPTYNRGYLIGEAIRSVLDQSYPEFELIIVDDGSTDNTREVVAAFKSEKIKYFFKQNEERAIARNYGAVHATGNYLIFLDSDDKPTPNHLLLIYTFLQANRFEPKFIFTGYKVVTQEGALVSEHDLSNTFRPELLAYGNTLGCSAVVIEASLFAEYKFNTDPHLTVFEDWELWLRVMSKTKLYCIPGKSIVLLNHQGRSVLNIDADYMVKRVNCLKRIVLNEVNLVSTSFYYRRVFLMGLYSYAALHLAVTKKGRLTSLNFLFKSFINNPAILLKKRFYAVLKHLI
jgi:glycosyltransferase involved in cell wall biosynthesis